MKDGKMKNIHHFADEFPFEDLKDEPEGEHGHQSKLNPVSTSQFAQMKKQIADLNIRIDKIEKLLDSKFWNQWAGIFLLNLDLKTFKHSYFLDLPLCWKCKNLFEWFFKSFSGFQFNYLQKIFGPVGSTDIWIWSNNLHNVN